MAGFVLALVVGAGCDRGAVTLTPLPSGAQAVSLLGDTLWNMPLEPGLGPLLVQQLQAAQRHLAARPGDPAAKLLVARRSAALGRLREAVALYSEVIAEEHGTARVYRRRGEILLMLREFKAAARDYGRAYRDPAGAVVKEFAEDSAGGLVGSLVRYQAALGLGLLHQVQGDYDRASERFLVALEHSDGADELVESGLWLSLALRRAGRRAEAAQVIGGIPSNIEVKNRTAEFGLLRMLRGQMGIDSIRSLAASGGPEDESLVLYVLGFVQLTRSDTTAARDAFAKVIELGQWTTRPYLAAEGELIRLAPRRR
ncbi:MAG: hypothetical protein FJ206_15605 [Gemmatimonadetes bacterium]|nr:hypothetical protein [Gemmatimonadota bacterium]